jgi:hypothetical protein
VCSKQVLENCPTACPSLFTDALVGHNLKVGGVLTSNHKVWEEGRGICFFLFSSVLRFELKVLSLLGRCSTS